MHQQLIEKTILASKKWQQYFNEGNAKGCTSMYEEQATMHAKPFGHYQGHNEIQGFWQHLIEQGFSEICYIQPKIEVIDDMTTILSSQWTMNHAQGVITKELWVLQENGDMLLREDNFEALQD